LLLILNAHAVESLEKKYTKGDMTGNWQIQDSNIGLSGFKICIPSTKHVASDYGAKIYTTEIKSSLQQSQPLCTVILCVY
jgi:hypothetical protein